MLPPEAAAYLQKMQDKNERIKLQLQNLYEEYKKREELLKGRGEELKRLRSLLRKAISKIRFVEDVPGKRVPYFLCFDVEVPGPTNPAFTLVNQRLSGVQTIPMDGSFVATAYMAAFRLKTFSLGPNVAVDHRTTDPVAGTEIITPLTGRFRPICSTADSFSGAYIGGGSPGFESNVADTSPPLTGGAWFTKMFRPGTIDFLWEVADEGSDRIHQNNLLTPSRYLYSEFDRPLYLPTSDFFERGSVIRFSAIMTRDLGFAELNFTTYTTTTAIWAEANISAADDFTIANPSDTMARMLVGLGGTLTFTMMGYKILQSQSPAV